MPGGLAVLLPSNAAGRATDFAPGISAQESGVCVTNESRPGRHPSGRVDSPPFNQMRPGRTETLKIAIYVTNDFLDAIYFKFETI